MLCRLLVLICIVTLIGCNGDDVVERTSFNRTVTTITPWYCPDIETSSISDAMLVSGEANSRHFILIKEDIINPNNIKILAEPSPDVISEITSSLNALIKADLKDKGSAEIGLLTTFANKINKLSNRSQAIILFRDASYRLAEAYTNNIIDSRDYYELFGKVYTDMRTILEKEIPLLYSYETSKVSNKSDVNKGIISKIKTQFTKYVTPLSTVLLFFVAITI